MGERDRTELDNKQRGILHGAHFIKLRGPGSQELTLQGVPTVPNTGWKMLAWEPTERGAQDIEVRARLVSARYEAPEQASIPDVEWFIELGHGDAVWTDPAPLTDALAPAPIQRYSLPARGMSWRAAVREFRIGFRNVPGYNTPFNLVETVVKVSVLPVWGAHAPLYPYAQKVREASQVPFPLTAREFRVLDFGEQPFALGVATILFLNFAGTAYVGSDAALFGEYLPIPHDATAFQILRVVPSVLPAYAYYR